jgi:enoyl-CoA hydratase/carnithine racemase
MRDLCLTGRSFGPAEAISLRVVDEIVEPESLIATARERAVALAAMPAYAAVKAQVRGPLIAELGRISAAPQRRDSDAAPAPK